MDFKHIYNGMEKAGTEIQHNFELVNKESVDTETDQVIKGEKTFSDGLITRGIKDMKLIEKTIQVGYGTTARLNRVGNIVTFSQNTVAKNGRPNGKTTMGEKIPEGFRPVVEMNVNATVIVGTDIQKDRYFSYLFEKDGEIVSHQSNMVAQPLQILAASCWITSDEFPS